MSYVFKKCPEEHTGQKSKRNSPGCKPDGATIIGHPNHYRGIHSPNHQRVCFCQHFKVGVLEKLRLALVINFFELHDAKIRKLVGERQVVNEVLADFNQSLRVCQPVETDSLWLSNILSVLADVDKIYPSASGRFRRVLKG